MDLEKLNKTQIILLVLFVSFVTSIATGIVTVTLMDQAPPAVTQTINRVVERTVEKVVPAKSQGASTVKTVIVKEESLVADLVEKNTNNVVEIFTAKNMVSNEDTDIELEIGGPVALGFVISSDGMIVADSGLISNKGKYIIQTKNKTARRIYVVGQDNKKHWIFNEETFNIGKNMGLWGGWDAIEIVGDDSYEEGHTMFFIK